MTPLSAGRPGSDAPAGWRWARLTDLARLETGHTPSRSHPEWWGGPIPWISLADIRELDGKIAQDTIEHTNDKGIANSAARLLPEGTVVLSRTASVGFVTIMGRPMATSQDFVNWVCGPELDPRFLAYLLQATRAYIRSLSSGAIHQTVYMPTVESFFVCTPPMEQQRRISRTLDEQSSICERMRAAAIARIEATTALAAASLRERFSAAGMNRWSLRPLGDVGQIVSGITLGRPTNGAATERVPYLRVANVKDGYLDLSHVNEIEATEAEIRRLRLQVGDLLLTEGGDPDKLGRGCVWEGELSECIHQNHVFRVRFPLDEIEPAFVSAQIGSAYGKAYFIAHAKQTTGIATINRSVLARFPLMLPSLTEQRRIARALGESAKDAARLEGELESEFAAVNALLAAFLRRAFSGEL